MDEVKDLVSVIIPVYMADESIERCINSVLCQSYSNIEIILIDDNSTDNSYMICNQFKLLDERIRLYRNKYNLGVSETRNKGLSLSKGEYIIFVDSDDYLESNYIQKLVIDIHDSNSELVIASVCYVRGNTEKKVLLADKVFNPNIEKNFLMYLIENNVLGYVPNKLFLRRVIFDNEIEFDCELRIFEDQKFVIDYIKKCNLIAIDSNICYFYVNNDKSTMNNLPYTYLNNCVNNYKVLKSLFPKNYNNIVEYEAKYGISVCENFFYNSLKRYTIEVFSNLMQEYEFHEYMVKYKSEHIMIKFMYKFKLFYLVYILYKMTAIIRKMCERNE